MRVNGLTKIAFIASAGLGFISLGSAASILSIVTAVTILGLVRGSFTPVKILAFSSIFTLFLLFLLGIEEVL
jgi:hypothetical protein